ncbi:MAG: protein kinase domain-containing protein, partial [Gemmataceae bacterium]
MSTPTDPPVCPRCQFPLTPAGESSPTPRPGTGTMTVLPDATPTPAPSPASPQPGVPARVGRFEVRRFVGEGAFGRVYEAYDPALKRAVALKVAKPEQTTDAKRVERFQREARSAGLLMHPHIVAVFDSGQDGPHHYIASAFVPGKTLDETLDGKPMAHRQAADVARKLAEALAYAHREGVVHRDVKPSNVMLREDGEPLLMDFGLAARSDDEKMTVVGQYMGTPAYTAPEQWQGEAGAASDQYSLGCLLYELLTGRTPFAGSDPGHLMVLHLRAAAPRMAGVPRDLETVVLKCLEKEPGRRYADCAALAEDLRRWLAGEAVAARRAGPLERLGRWARREPVTAALAAAAAAFLLSGMGGMTVLYFRAEEARQGAINATALAKTERDLARAHEAEAKRMRAQADEQANRSRVVTQVMTGMFQSADPVGLNGLPFGTGTRFGQSLTAAELLEQALRTADQEPPLEPTIKADVYQSVGSVYRSIGLHDKAEPLLVKAAAARRAGPATPAELAGSLHALGWLRHQRGDYLTAEGLYRESIAVLTEPGAAADGSPSEARRQDEVLSDARFNLAWLLAEMNVFDESEVLFRQVIRARLRHFAGDHRPIAMARYGLAGLYLRQERNVEAMWLIVLGNLSLRSLGTDSTLMDGIASFQMGVAAYRSAEWLTPVAERYLHQSIDATRKALGPRHAYVGLPLAQLGQVVAKRGRHEEALKHYQEALDVALGMVGLEHPILHNLVTLTGASYLQLKRPGEARALVEKVLDARRRRFGEGH